MAFLESLWMSFIFTAPAFFANSVPVFTSGLGRIDGGRNFRDGKPLLGSHKTIGGALGGLLGAVMVGLCTPIFFPEVFDLTKGYNLFIAVLLGFGALLGDAIGSFIKRRTSIKSGRPFPIMDQIGFIVVALILASLFMDFPTIWAWIIIPATLAIHFTANIIAFLFGWKEVWW